MSRHLQTEEQRLATIKAAGVAPKPTVPIPAGTLPVSTPEAATGGFGFSAPVIPAQPKPIPVSALTSDERPVEVAPVEVTPPLDITSIPEAEIKAPEIPEQPKGDVFADIEAATAEIEGRDREADISVATAGVQKQLIEKNKELRLLQAQSLKAQEEAAEQGETIGFAGREVARARRQFAFETLRVSAELEALQGNLNLAEIQAGRAIDEKYKEQEADLKKERQDILNIYDSLTKAEQSRADEILLEIDSDDAFVKEKKQAEKDIASVKNEIAASGKATNRDLARFDREVTNLNEANLFGAPFLVKKEIADEKKLLTVAEAKALGKPFGTTREEAFGIVPGVIRTSADLTPFERLSARNLSVEIFGRRAGTKIENISLIENLVAGGMTIDEIKDNLRFEGQSAEFTGVIRDAAESIGFSMTSDKQERFFNSVDRSVEDGDMVRVKEILIRGAIAALGTEEGKKVRGDLRAVELFDEIASDLEEFVSKNGDTNIFKGTNERVTQAIGKTTDPELAAIANKIQIAIQTYRRAISGAAFTESESKEYTAIFPSISKTSDLNLAKIQSAQEVLQGNSEFVLSSIMGKTAFDELFGEAAPSGGIESEIDQLSPEQEQKLKDEGLL